ncbi:hypothetical protein [Myxococcus sp. RHSTA-1-4]|uniref:hypothetical protein n=1 Tax=Myxococcus sp. RHSTA-1-4 TaxID=2874601 RepID=UPI001CC02242|nr:hypothetical protein [Myxococcus sp. RHSTA-1-4]MBZ4418115.1 hypothetical protein [Myxococcus sp. RHSTA-1-4]
MGFQEGVTMRGRRMFGAVLAGAVLTLGGIGVLGLTRSASPPAVVVRLENRTGQDVREVRIEHEDGQVVHRGLRAGESLALSFAPKGESSYRLTAVLADGKVLEGGFGYVEPGFETREVLEPGGVVSSWQ